MGVRGWFPSMAMSPQDFIKSELPTLDLINLVFSLNLSLISIRYPFTQLCGVAKVIHAHTFMLIHTYAK